MKITIGSWRSWVPIVATSTGAYVLAIMASMSLPVQPLPLTLLSVGAVLTAFSIVVSLRAQGRAHRSEAEAKAALSEALARENTCIRERIHDRILPVSAQLHNILLADEPHKATQRESALVHILNETAKLIPNDRSRACLHAWTLIDDGFDGTVEALVPLKGTGRAQRPTMKFRRDEIEGLEVFTYLLADRARLVSDTTTNPPQGWNAARPCQYKSFVSAPVTIGGRLWGMLSLDSPQPGELRDHHLLGVRFMASMLGNALAAGHVTSDGPAVGNTSTITLTDSHRQVIKLPDPAEDLSPGSQA